MARRPRIHYPDAVYHVMSRGVDGRAIFATDDDRREFLASLKQALSANGAALLSYCLMSNHYHLLATVGKVPLDVVMRQTLGRYTVHFNRTCARVGHLFQSRYTAILCRNLAYLVRTIAYIHSNPVRASMVSHPGEWAWSSHRELLGETGGLLDLTRLAEVSGMTLAEIREHYLDRITPRESAQPRTLAELLEECSAAFGVTDEDVVGGAKGGPFTQAKKRLIREAGLSGYSDADIARALKCSRAAVASLKNDTVKKGPGP